MDLSVKFEDFDSTVRFIVLEMDKYDLILGMPWLEKHEPWIDWRGKAIGASRPALSARALVSHVPTSVKSKGVHQDHQGAEAPEEFMGVAEVFGVPQEVAVDSVKESAEALPDDLRSQTGVAQGDSGPKAKALQTRSSDGHYRVFDSETGLRVKADAVQLEALSEVAELLNLEAMSLDDFLADLKAGEIAEMVLLRPDPTPEELNPSSVMDEDVLEEFRKQRTSRLDSEILTNTKDPVYPLMKEFEDVVSKDPPSQLPPDRGIRHEIDLVPGCVTRQLPVPREQCEAIDAFFAAKAKAGMLREPNATVPAQTPIPRKDVLLNSMTGCTLYSALDLVDGYYQILTRESDIPLTAVSTPSGMLWEWLVMPQGLSNAPATVNRLVTQLFRPLRAFAQTYFDDIFVHSRAENGQTAMEVHLGHLRRVFEVMRANKLYANIDKCVFGAEEIKVLGCFVSSAGVRADPEGPSEVVGLGQLSLCSAGYAGLAKPLSDLLKKDTDWRWERQHQEAFESIKASLQRAPILALPDESKPQIPSLAPLQFSVDCDVSDYAIGCALMQTDEDGHERVISFQSRQLKAAERNYPVHDKELLP
ncbi:unnamed protein product [Phytophthora fragariaefolia]|uniref:Unnamed protein product n=1 Tax=Phytophthora fragariaefolia TaxID=1490495 RepID=A0A9W6TM80_9STRA|nr:unnamed protein product [Phytophthora fragariaefolia]